MLMLTHQTLMTIRADQANREAKAIAKAEEKAKANLRKLNHKIAERLVENVTRILKTGEPTKFEFEAACRHGIRKHLILRGWRWADADNAAAQVVAKALHRIGAERPSWADGQPESAANYELDRLFCAHHGCGKMIPEERRATGRAKYCSDLCNQAASLHRNTISGERRSMAQWLAECAERSAKMVQDRTRPCAYEPCSRPFIADKFTSKFCSYTCANRAATKLEPARCANVDCAKPFKPRMVRARGQTDPQPQRYCSIACSWAGRRRAKSTFQCEPAEPVSSANEWDFLPFSPPVGGR